MPLAPFDCNLRHLRGVTAIAARGTLSAAAGDVALSQPALTQGLAKLEAQLGAALFERRPGAMVATRAGTAVAARAHEAFGHLREALRGTARGSGRAPDRAALLTATQVRAMLALADAGSFVGAAAATGLSQPALHRAVRDTERVAGAVLVERRGRGVALTEAGSRVARGFRLAALAIEAGIAEARPPTRGGAGRIAIGAMPMARARLLPWAIARLHAAHPGVETLVVEGAHRELIDQLRDGRIDCAVGALRALPGPDIVQRPLFDDRLAVIARADHPLAGLRMADRAALAAFPWIVGRPDTPLRTAWERLFAGGPLPPAPIDCGSVMIVRELLRGGDWLTLLSPEQVRLEIEAGVLGIVQVEGFDGARTIGVSTRADWRATAAQAGFMALLGAFGEQRLPESR